MDHKVTLAILESEKYRQAIEEGSEHFNDAAYLRTAIEQLVWHIGELTPKPISKPRMTEKRLEEVWQMIRHNYDTIMDPKSILNELVEEVNLLMAEKEMLHDMLRMKGSSIRLDL